MAKVKVLILTTSGTNCDSETLSAFEECKAQAEKAHINSLIANKDKIQQCDILALPGGFSYGDDISSGKILANEIKNKLSDAVRKFALSGKPIIGICNGFQILVKMGLLPDPELFEQTVSLSCNDSNKFECRWIYLKTQQTKCLWTKDLPSTIDLPIAHGEGKFTAKDGKILKDLENNGQIVFRYCSKEGLKPSYPLDPNGSEEQIAAVCNKKGNILGIMPHPERFVFSFQHPLKKNMSGKYGWGKKIFQNAVDFTIS